METLSTHKGSPVETLHLAPIVVGKLMSIGGMLQRHSNKLLQPYGLNQQQFSVFFEIANVGQVKQKEMINRLQLEKAHVSKVVKKLHAMGLITVTPSTEDKRSAWLEVTPEGKELLEKVRAEFRASHEAWLEDIDATQLESILDSLTLLQRVFGDKL